MIPLTNYDFQGSGEQGSVVIIYPYIYIYYPIVIPTINHYYP